ncbi:MAG: hypothetical protein WAU70_12075 [Flavobacteriales bacterium]
MYAYLLTITLSLAFAMPNASNAATVLTCTIPANTLNEDGGPPRIQVCGKATGDVTLAQWKTTDEVKLVGCVPTARITSLSVCIKNCEAKQEALTGTNGTLTPAMKKMISNLPAGTTFTVRVAVVDETGKKWEVPDAAFVWKG